MSATSRPRQLTLKAEHLSKAYHNRPVVRDVSLTVRTGEVAGLLGPNGAGKTTGFYMIMGLTRPDSGRILLDGQDVTDYPVYRRARAGVGYLPQETSVFRGMSVEDNIMSILEIAEPNADRRAARLEELLADFSITHLRRSLGVTLSGGERRRAEIARTLAGNPHFILLDEPLAGVDPLVVADVKKLIMNLKKRNIGVLITDHNVRDALDMIDRAYIIYDGVILKQGSPQEIVDDEDVKRVYLGEDFYYGARSSA